MRESVMSQTPSLRGSELRVSFEFFPPKTEKMEENLWRSIERLAPLCPSFVSVTYGAGGSTRERTHQTIERILKETALTPAAHLTCVDASREEVDDVVRQYWETGVRHFVALRGDGQNGVGGQYVPRADGYRNAVELVAGLKAFADFEISVAAYPEKHPESPDFATDIDLLKRKVDNGATRAITQFFFDNDVYERYVERVRRAGVYIPIVPGIVPIHDFTKVARFSNACGAKIPSWLAERFDGLEDDPQTRSHVAAAVCAEQVLDLQKRGLSDFHFYTMNRADLVYSICHILGLRAGNAATAPTSKAAAA
ncbi:methylenetetrahydrofolate reductase [NAD(P)H] [Aurantimonas sp. A2-1-M11]|uniref:methylenetetrahydrofolate reductase [NAD(P)H] n=1 Tax=Aurantimonas sp. A2-1-M11 TaxID=3113712 RepID=UPI003FA5E9ED